MQFSSAILSPSGLLFLILIFSLIWLRKKTWRLRYLMSQLPQGPPPLPVFGNALDLLQGGLDHVLQVLMVDWPSKYGEIFCSYIGPNWNVNISSPELMESVLNSQKVLDKGYSLFSPWLGEGLLVSSGEKWKLRRRLLTPAFHFKNMDDFLNIFNKQSQILCNIFQDRCSQSSESGTECDVFPFLVNCTLDIISEAATGLEMHSQTVESEYSKALHRVDEIVIERYRRPWFTNETLFSITPTGRQNRQLLNVIHRFSEKIIETRRAQVMAKTGDEEISNPSHALLDLMLNTSDKKKLRFTDQDIREEIDTFMFAGHDTTASAISFFLYCMATNPQYQERVFDELQDVFGNGDDMLRNCTQQDLPNLQFLECCIKEAMRLYSPVPYIKREVQQEIQIGEHLIPAGANLVLLIYAMHRNPRLYPDPLVYNPERFFPDQFATKHPYSFIPFSAGPRNCIGQRFAMIEMKVLLAWLFRRFTFSVSHLRKAPDPSFQVVLKPMQGIHLIVTPR